MEDTPLSRFERELLIASSTEPLVLMLANGSMPVRKWVTLVITVFGNTYVESDATEQAARHRLVRAILADVHEKKRLCLPIRAAVIAQW